MHIISDRFSVIQRSYDARFCAGVLLEQFVWGVNFFFSFNSKKQKGVGKLNNGLEGNIYIYG